MTDYLFPDLSPLLSPRSIAVIGASTDVNKTGGRVLINLQKSHFQGKIFPVNPKYEEIFGLKAYPALSRIEEEVDTAVVTVPAKAIQGILQECAEKKVKFVIVLSAGFAELGKEGAELQQELKAFADEAGIRIYGPNSPGLFNILERTGISLSPSYEPKRIQQGGVCLISQGGGLGRAVLDANDRGIGFNYWISTGNEADLEVSDFIYHFAHDPSTRVIITLIEGLKDGRKFRRAAEAARKFGKPMIALKIGQSDLGRKAVMSHTGSLTGADQVYSAFFKQLGVIRVDDLDELIDVAWLFAAHKNMAGDRIGIYSFSGGAGALIADKCGLADLKVPDLDDHTKALLHGLLPDIGVPSNPTDLTTYVFQDPDAFPKCLEIFAEDPNFDLILVPFPYKLGTSTEIMARHTVSIAKRSQKPIIPVWTSLSGELEMSYEVLADSRLPFYRTVTGCVKAIRRFTDYCLSAFAPIKWETLPNPYPKNRQGVLTEWESKKLFHEFGIPVVEEKQAASEEEACQAANHLGYPVVLKILSRDILHKTEAGGVKLQIQNESELRVEYRDMMKGISESYPKARADGVLVQKMAVKGTEIIAGIKRDPIFGPVVMVGAGGIFTEVFRDVSMRVAPLSERDAEEMIKELRSYAYLLGVRGEKAKDVEALKKVLLCLSNMAMSLWHCLEEAELNPLLLYEADKGAVAVDGLVIFRGSEGPSWSHVKTKRGISH